MKNIVINPNVLHDCLVYNNRFGKSKKLTAEQIGAEGLASWKAAINKLHEAAYKVSEHCENNDLKTADSTVDMNPLYEAIRGVLTIVGKVNGYKLEANLEIAICAVKYASKVADHDSANLQFVRSQISNVKKQLREVEQFGNGVNKEYIDNLEKSLANFEAERDELIKQPDNRVAKPTRTSEADFRGNVEHKIARLITGQCAKSWEELEAEAKAKRDKKNKKNNERKRAKKAEESKNAETK